ncbi:MAG: translocation/assembly module TamB domain-containing protein [Mariniphaga sp.]|nr:translocation/assembly module TamB domain-containing protein [Mariniphaga sp.]
MHKAITKKTNTILLEKNIPVQIGKITLLLNGKIGVNEMAMITPPNDTIIYIGKLRIDLGSLPLLSNKIYINEVILNDAVVNILTDTITDELQIMSALNPSDKEPKKTQAGSTKLKNSWDIDVRTIRLKNIRFVYSDPNNGILIKEKLYEAEIDLDKLSLSKNRVDLRSIKIDKSYGIIRLWPEKEKPKSEITQNAQWKFSAKNLEINDMYFAFEQPDTKQRIDVTFKKGNVSLQNLDLETQEILVYNIRLTQPEVTFEFDNKIKTETTQQESFGTITIPYSPWTIIADKLSISDGNLNFNPSANGQMASGDNEKLNVYKLNASFNETRLSPKDYSLNLDELSFNMDSVLVIDSGSINLELDSLQNTALKINLSALLKKKKGWFAKKQTLDFNAKIGGTTSAMEIQEFGINSGTGFNFSITGILQEPLKMENSLFDLQFASDSVSRDLLIPIANLFSPKTELPDFRPFIIAGRIKDSLLNPVFDVKIKSESGQIEASGNYNIKNTTGILQASITNILLNEFFGESYPDHITGTIQLQAGLNSQNLPEGEATVKIDSIKYKNKITRNINVHADAHNSESNFIVLAGDSSLNLDLKGSVDFRTAKSYSGTLEGFFDIDLFGLKLIDEPFAGNGNINSSFNYSPTSLVTSVALNDLRVSNNKNDETIEKFQFNINKNDSLIESDINSDFLNLNFLSHASYNDFQLSYDSTSLSTAVTIDSTSFVNLRTITNLEQFNLDAIIKHSSVFNLFYPDSVLNFSDVNLNIQKADINSRAEANLSTEWINYNSIKSYNQKLRMRIEPDGLDFRLKTDSIISGEVKYGKSGFEVDVSHSLLNGTFEVSDIKDTILHRIGFEARRENDDLIFTSTSPSWLINRIPWTLSLPKFLTFDKSTKSLITSLDLKSGNKRFWLKGNSESTIELDIKNIELKNLAFAEFIGFVPEGTINGDIKYNNKKRDELELNLEMQKMKWDNVYFNLLTAKGHLVADSLGISKSEIQINADDSLSLLLEMKTNKTKNEYEVKSKFNKLQFKLFEPFINDVASNLHGTSDGEIILAKQNEKLDFEGEIRFNEFGLKLIPLQARLTIPDNKIEIKNNQILFNNFTVIDSLKHPLSVNGNINFVDKDDINLDLKVKADRIQIMNTPESMNVPLYGSIIVNSGLTIGGSIYKPNIKGNVELENGTNLTYQLIQDLSVNGSQYEVIFAEISDSMKIIYPQSVQVKKSASMPNIDATVRINPKSIFNVKIDDLYNIDIVITGDGLLNYNMLPNNSMSLDGSYEIQSGDCNLKITGWPLKQFTITPGSSFSWNGKVENPILNLEATTKVRGSYINPIDNNSRVVDFIVSMQLKDQLSNLSIVFGIQSPDQYINSVLNYLSSDEMMRQAVNLLLFETIEIPGVESSGNYLTSQINSFWESQLNSITTANMNKTKLSFGVDTYNQSTSSGGQQEKTSLTYEMERKFMNDRATIKVSGRLNNNQEDTYQSNSLVNNFIIEYALDSLNTKNIKLYQKRDYEDMLEGEVTKNGVGFLYRKNYKSLKDIWQRKKRKKQTIKTVL